MEALSANAMNRFMVESVKSMSSAKALTDVETERVAKLLIRRSSAIVLLVLKDRNVRMVRHRFDFNKGCLKVLITGVQIALSDISVDVPKLLGDGYLSYDTGSSEAFKDETSLSLDIHTNVSDGLILWIGQVSLALQA